jgi:intein/homing endonuclease/TolA-binding protein
MAETERITIAETSEGQGGNDHVGADVSLPVVEILTGRGFMTGKSGAGKSILEGTPVYTASGRKPIERVEEGDEVLSLNKHTYEQEFRKVQGTIEHRDDRLLRVTLEDGTEVVGTVDHSFLTAKNLEIVPIRGDELEDGMWMPLSRELPSPGTVRRVDLGEYVDDTNNVVVDGGTITSGPRTENRELRMTFPTGKEIGLYLAEGSLDGHMTIQIANVDDDVKEFLDSRGYNVYKKTSNKGFRPYARFLEAQFGRGSGGKRLPDWVFDAPTEFRKGLLSGYFDGDGTVGETDVAAMSKSAALIDGLRELLRQFGISTTVRDKLTVYDDEGRQYRRLTVDSFCVERFRDVVELSVSGKSQQLATLCEELATGDRYNSKDMVPNFGPILNTAAREAGWTNRESENRSAGASVHNLTRKQKAGRKTYNRLIDELDVTGRAKAFGESDIQWKRVVSVERIDEERTVYDLDVELNDNFLANGVFVHNSNSASVIAEKLLDGGFGLLIVDVDGEYYGLKEEYEILHVGGDEECDIQVTTEHSEKLASLALDQNVPIILDMSSYLDEEEAEALLTAVARSLFAKAKKRKQPFLLLIEEVHEYIPEKGSVGECGKMLIKIGKRGRKHGLGICGISQRPADVKKDFITQCDWLLWHRLTWNNDTTVVRRILNGEYADAVESLDDGEGFLMTDWAESVQRVQFYRKRTFDAGATPGLEDFERPDLKSVSDDLVSELQEITEDQEARESRITELREELDAKNSRIAELEAELQDARDLSRMAEQFVGALLQHVEGPAPGRTERERMQSDDPVDSATVTVPVGDGETGSDGASEADVSSAVTDALDNKSKDDSSAHGADASGSDQQDEFSADEILATLNGVTERRSTESRRREPTLGEEVKATVRSDAEVVTAATTSDTGASSAGRENEEPLVVRELKADIAAMETKTRGMLSYYREVGPGTPLNAHLAAGGDGNRKLAYAHNRTLRTAGLIEHVGRGHYDYRLRELLCEELDGVITEEQLDAHVEKIESTALDG